MTRAAATLLSLGALAVAACGGHGTVGVDGSVDVDASVDVAREVADDAPATTDVADAKVEAYPTQRPDGQCIPGAGAPAGMPCTCGTSVPDPCPDKCVALAVDDANCGACGHACTATQACSAGVCGPDTVEVVPASPGCQSIDLAALRGTLVWTDEGHGLVRSLAPGASSPTTLVTGEHRPLLLVASDGATPAEAALYWVSATDKTVRKTEGLDGLPATLATSPTDIAGLTISSDGASVYYSTQREIMRVPAAGGAPVAVAKEWNNAAPAALAVVGNHLGFTELDGGHVYLATLVENGVAYCNKQDAMGIVDTSTCFRMGSSGGGLAAQMISFAGLFYCSSNGPSVHVREPKTDDRSYGQEIAAMERGFVVGMALTSSTIYLSNTEGGIWKAPVTPGSTAVRIARGENARAVAVDAERVYWSTEDCAIMATTR